MSIGIFKSNYSTHYQYRKAIAEWRRRGCIIRRVCGGVLCFESPADYETWKAQI